jgi:hypothetical protein
MHTVKITPSPLVVVSVFVGLALAACTSSSEPTTSASSNLSESDCDAQAEACHAKCASDRECASACGREFRACVIQASCEERQRCLAECDGPNDLDDPKCIDTCKAEHSCSE